MIDNYNGNLCSSARENTNIGVSLVREKIESGMPDEIEKMYAHYSSLSIRENNDEQGAIIQEIREAVLRLIINLGTDSAAGMSESHIGERPVNCLTQACAWNTVNLKLLIESLTKLENFIGG